MRRITVPLVSFALAASACGKKPVTNPTTATTVAAATTATTVAATTAAATTAAPATPDAGAVAAGDDAAAPGQDDAYAAAPETTEAAADAAAAEPQVDPKIAALEAKAKELVTNWVAAQNQANFDAYSAFYAPRFTGIKRSGPRQRTFGLKGWLADRQNMFKNAMQVSADEVQVVVSSETAIVTFVQSWASGTYSDKGPKQLVLVPGAKDGLQIAREEMLVSEVQDEAAAPKAIEPDVFSFGIDVAGAPYVVLPVAEVDSSWGKDAPTLAKKTGPTTVVRATDTDKLPAEIKGWLGKKVTTADGCAGTIDRIDLVGRYVPHFGTVQHWNGTDGVNEVGKPMTDAAIAAEAWDAGALDVEVAGHIEGCKMALWVRDSAKPAPVTFVQDAADAKLEKAALAEFRKLDGWKAIQTQAKAPDSGVTTATWDVFDGAAPVVVSWSDAASGRTFVQVAVTAGNGCGGFGGALGAIFEVKNKETKPTFVLMSDPQGGPVGAIQEVVDVDGDGDVEFVLDQGLIQRAGPVWKQTIDLTPPDFDCPC